MTTSLSKRASILRSVSPKTSSFMAAKWSASDVTVLVVDTKSCIKSNEGTVRDSPPGYQDGLNESRTNRSVCQAADKNRTVKMPRTAFLMTCSGHLQNLKSDHRSVKLGRPSYKMATASAGRSGSESHEAWYLEAHQPRSRIA